MSLTYAQIREASILVSRLDCDPEMAWRWCRDRGRTPEGILREARALAEELPWPLARPEGPVDLRRWVEVTYGKR